VRRRAIPVLLPSTMMTDDMHRLNALAKSSEERLPKLAYFLAGKSAAEVEDSAPLNGIIRMGPQVRYRDKTSAVQDVVLVWPHEPDIALKHISVLTRGSDCRASID
jgi:regulator of nucleoside diphosphate kinase